MFNGYTNELSSVNMLWNVWEIFAFLPLGNSIFQFSSVQFRCSVISDSLQLLDCSTPGFPVHHQLLEVTQTHVQRVGDAIQPYHPLCPLILLPSIFPSIMVFSNESTLHMRWPKYWSFSFNVSPSNEHPGLVSFRIN